MTKLLISTTRRHTPVNEISGRLITFDLDSKEVVKTTTIIEPPFRELNPNPRGGIRGLKGISVVGERLAIANSSSIFVYDKDWQLRHTIEHPSLAGIHDIFFTGDSLWVSSARNDVIANIDLNGKINDLIDVRSLDNYRSAFPDLPKKLQSYDEFVRGAINFRDPTTHDESAADSAHVNSVIISDDGELYFSAGLVRRSSHLGALRWKNMLARVGLLKPALMFNDLIISTLLKRKKKNKNETVASPFSGKSLFLRRSQNGEISTLLQLGGVSVPSHSIRQLDAEHFAYLKTFSGELLLFGREKNAIEKTIRVGEKFLRGLAKLDKDLLVAGDGNDIVLVDPRTQKVLSRHQISEDVNENVFDILTLPAGFSLPPNDFNNQ